MQGKHDGAGDCRLTWNSQGDRLYSPDHTQHCLPCDDCGQPQWVSLRTVSVLCLACGQREIEDDGLIVDTSIVS